MAAFFIHQASDIERGRRPGHRSGARFAARTGLPPRLRDVRRDDFDGSTPSLRRVPRSNRPDHQPALHGLRQALLYGGRRRPPLRRVHQQKTAV